MAFKKDLNSLNCFYFVFGIFMNLLIKEVLFRTCAQLTRAETNDPDVLFRSIVFYTKFSSKNHRFENYKLLENSIQLSKKNKWILCSRCFIQLHFRRKIDSFLFEKVLFLNEDIELFDWKNSIHHPYHKL